MQTGFGRPAALACVRGDAEHSAIRGTVRFYPFRSGVLVEADIHALPRGDGPCGGPVLGFHIHEGGSCQGEGFPLTQGHFNPGGCPHPQHAGDLPPLFSNGGTAYMAVYTDRFTVGELIGRTVVIHDMRDDFTTQPSGGSGEKIACGVIRRAG